MQNKAVVLVGNFMGHVGHQFLISQAKHRFPDSTIFVLVGPKQGKDDPLDQKFKMTLLNQMGFDNVIVSGWTPKQTCFKKIEFEIIPKFSEVVILCGSDRFHKYTQYWNSITINKINSRFKCECNVIVSQITRTDVSSTQIRKQIRMGDYDISKFYPYVDAWQQLKIVNQVLHQF